MAPRRPVATPHTARARTLVPRTVGPDGLLLGALATLLVICGSLTPFQFSDLDANSVGLSRLHRITFAPASGEDLFVNLLVYIPVGFTICGLCRRVMGRTSALGWATLTAAVLSILIETLQTYSAARSASWIDVLLNTGSALIGALLTPVIAGTLSIVFSHLRGAFKANPAAALTTIVTVGLIVHGLAPFDFVTSDAGFRQSLRTSTWWPVALRPHWKSSAIGAQYATFWSNAGVAGAFILLGILRALGNRRPDRSDGMAWTAAVGHVACVAFLMEALQLFVVSHNFSTLDLLTNGTAGALGVWLGSTIADSANSTGRPWAALCRLPAAAFALPVVLHVAVLLGAAWTPSAQPGLQEPQFGLGSACGVPFARYYHMPFVQAVGAMTARIVAYGLLAGLLAAYQWRRRGRARWSLIAIVTVATVAGSEFVQGWIPFRTVDITQPILAMVAVLLCGIADFRLRSSESSSRRA